MDEYERRALKQFFDGWHEQIAPPTTPRNDDDPPSHLSDAQQAVLDDINLHISERDRLFPQWKKAQDVASRANAHANELARRIRDENSRAILSQEAFEVLQREPKRAF